MNADGSGVIQLTNDNQANCCPAWSPDGSKIAFVVQVPEDDTSEIWVMNADGSNQTNLTNIAGEDCCLAWSPDGSKIAFFSDRDPSWGIYVMNADGSNPIWLTFANVEHTPVWSPDDTRIAFLIKDFGDPSIDIYVMNADGSNIIKLTDTGETTEISWGEPSFTWSPDGTKIAYAVCSVRNYESCEIYVMNADGSNPINLSTSSASDRSPAWSPDGGKIAFFSGREHDWAIYVMNTDGSNRIRLTTDVTTGGRYPVWSPDGSKIAFINHVKDYVHVMNADGSGLTYTTLRSSSLLSWLPTIATPSTSGPNCTSGWTRLTAGTLAQVSEASTTSNRVRARPSRGNDVIAQLPPGTVVNVLEGPVCADGLVFWKVESELIPSGVGWTAEGTGQGVEYYLEPYAP
jgi:TolB protein